MARTPRALEPKPARVANENAGVLRKQIAPWPVIDRWPILLGSNLSIQYLASVYRIAQNGYRQQYVDALDELLERDPHTQSQLAQRVITVASGRVELTPAHVPGEETSPERERALEIAKDIQRRFDAIPAKTGALYALLFAALYYGAGSTEILYRCDGPTDWSVTGLGFIHSRRIAYPDQNDWTAHIWDQGAVMGQALGLFPTERFFGIRIRDVPGKFLFHAPTHRADYPTRDGLGRTIGFWQVIKNMAARGGMQYVERYGKPWALGSYSTDETSTGKPRAADTNDIEALNTALQALGVGSLAGVALPDSVKITLLGPEFGAAVNGLNHEKLIALCDSQISKTIRGGTLQSDAGEKGARSLGEVHAEGDVRNARYDAACLADTLKEGLIWWLTHLNYPGEEHLCPGVTIHVEQTSPDELLDRAVKLAAVCGEIDGKELAEKLGLKLVRRDDPDAVRLAPLKPTDLFALIPSSAQGITSAVQALASMTGVNLSPQIQSAIAEMDRDDAARLVQELLGKAKSIAKGAAAQGAAGDQDPKTAPNDGATNAPAESPEQDQGAQKRPAGAAKTPAKNAPKKAAKKTTSRTRQATAPA
jgi:phage gp29-like protein